MTFDSFENFMYSVYGVVFVFGALFGSFLNVCIYRIPRRHFTLTRTDLESLTAAGNTSAMAQSGLLSGFARSFWGILRFLGLHPGPTDGAVPAPVRDRLVPMQDQDYVTLNDFADALEQQLPEEDVNQYGDLILQHATQRPESIVFPASHCPVCQTPIKPWDNIPILSFLFLNGVCRTCGAKISWRYPVIEFLTASLYVGLVAQFGITPAAFAYMVFVSLLIIISGIDLDHQLIPDVLSVPGIILGILAVPFLPIAWQDAFLGILVGGGLIWSTGFLGKLIFRKEAMGGGDVKLMALIGAFLGWKMVFLTIFFASLSGALIGIIFKLLTGKEYIPFGPFLSLGALLTLYIGPYLFTWYGGYWEQIVLR